jgi:hypothetical protein
MLLPSASKVEVVSGISQEHFFPVVFKAGYSPIAPGTDFVTTILVNPTRVNLLVH